MLTEHLPTTSDSDEYIRAWAENKGIGKGQIKVIVDLLSCSPNERHTALICYDKPENPVERMKTKMFDYWLCA